MWVERVTYLTKDLTILKDRHTLRNIKTLVFFLPKMYRYTTDLSSFRNPWYLLKGNWLKKAKWYENNLPLAAERLWHVPFLVVFRLIANPSWNLEKKIWKTPTKVSFILNSWITSAVELFKVMIVKDCEKMISNKQT